MPLKAARVFPLLMESEAGLYDFDLTRFFFARTDPYRSKNALN
jgi:hypothetical protein